MTVNEDRLALAHEYRGYYPPPRCCFNAPLKPCKFRATASVQWNDVLRAVPACTIHSRQAARCRLAVGPLKAVTVEAP